MNVHEYDLMDDQNSGIKLDLPLIDDVLDFIMINYNYSIYIYIKIDNDSVADSLLLTV